MGTNYYVKLPPRNKCNHCQREDQAEEIHIGKNSGGWKFGFNPKFRSWREWYKFLVKPENVFSIYDEYGRKVPIVDFVEMVEAAQDGIWINDPRYTERGRWDTPESESLDPEGYRIINSESFC